jgi:hypothetical protein
MHLYGKVVAFDSRGAFEWRVSSEWDLRLFHSCPPIKPSVRLS